MEPTTSAPPRPHAVLYHPSFRDFAGAELVAAWIMQSLQATHRPVVWAMNPPDWGRIDRRFGTNLSSHPPQALSYTRVQRLFAFTSKKRGALLLDALVQRQLRHFHLRNPSSLWLGTYNESPLPAPGWLYLHHPERMRRPRAEPSWPWLRKRLYAASKFAADQVGFNAAVPPDRHRKLANSRWTQQAYAAIGGGESQVVYPPVPPFAAGLPWAQRQDRVVMLGRWAMKKGMLRAIEIVRQVRAAGTPLTLAFAGFWHCPPSQQREIETAAAGKPWITWHENCSRAELMQLAGSSRYGLHAMEGEHFGIAVAELLTAGCIVVVPQNGGPAEIVGDSRQTYLNADEAVEKLRGITGAPALQSELHARARPQGLRFAPPNFSRALLAALEIIPPSAQPR